MPNGNIACVVEVGTTGEGRGATTWPSSTWRHHASERLKRLSSFVPTPRQPAWLHRAARTSG